MYGSSRWYLVLLFGNMDSHFNHPYSIVILAVPSKDFQMIHNGTAVSTILMTKFDSGGGSQIMTRIHMLKADHGRSFPILSIAHHLPIIAIVTRTIAFSVRRYLLLLGQWGSDIVRMQISKGFKMSQSDDLSALDGFGHPLGTTGGGSPPKGIARHVVGTPNPPQGIGRGRTGNGRHNLLATSSSQILSFRIQKMSLSRRGFGLDVT